VTTPCRIRAPLIDPTGTLRPNTDVVFQRKGGVVGQEGALLLPFDTRARSDSTGMVELELMPGEYTGLASGSGRPWSFPVAVPDTEDEVLADLTPQASNIPIDNSLVAETKGYRNEASDFADATAADRIQTGIDATATADDRVQTGLDRAATAADRVQTGLDRAATAADRVATGLDAAATAADRAAIETSLLVYITDDAQSLTIAVSDTMVVAEGTSPYPTVTLEFATP
jgi:hypothetical protein